MLSTPRGSSTAVNSKNYSKKKTNVEDVSEEILVNKHVVKTLRGKTFKGVDDLPRDSSSKGPPLNLAVDLPPSLYCSLRNHPKK